MQFLFLMAIPVVLVWGLVYLKSNTLNIDWIKLNLPVVATLALIAGVLVGYDFFHKSVITIDRIAWAGMLGYFAVQWLRRGNGSVRQFRPIDIAILGLFMLIVFSTLSHDWRYRENLPMGRLLFFNLMPVGFYLATRFTPFSDNDIKVHLWLMVGLGVILSLLGIAELREWYSLVWPRYIADPAQQEFFGRARGPLMNPIANGMLMLVALASALALWAKQPQDQGITSKHTRRIVVQRVLIVISILILLAGLFATKTRSNWVAAILVFGVFVWYHVSPRQRVGLAAAALIGGVMLVGGFGKSLNSFKRDKYVTAAETAESITLRPMLAYVAWDMFQDRPLIGFGFGQYTKAKKPYHQQTINGQPLQKVLPYMQHNVFLSYVTELGLFGLGFLGTIIALVGFHIRRVITQATCQLRSRVGLAAGAILLSWIVNGMFHDVSIIPMIGSLVYFWFGLISQVSTSLETQTASLETQIAHTRLDSTQSTRAATVQTG